MFVLEQFEFKKLKIIKGYKNVLIVLRIESF